MKKKLIIKFLGTSSSESMPRDDDCPQCLSKDKKDRRLRSAILINKKILIDAGPDIATQISKENIRGLEAVLITHEHTDHVGGLKDLLRTDRNIRIIKLKAGQHFKLIGIEFHAFKVRHSNMVPTVGVEIDNVVYIPDYADLDFSNQYLEESKVAILDGSCFGRSFNGHLSINESIAKTKQLKNLKDIYFTHNGHTKRTHKDLEKTIQKLGDTRYHLAYDGFVLEI
jgi:phosphoribosyl 1,2-cyclic phosphate phosphodiesterase